ncbi:MAG TPA: hypothetical protein VN647_08040 [Nitrospira sp.]|nr:hypothetical protein [Nitrospira sp.]
MVGRSLFAGAHAPGKERLMPESISHGGGQEQDKIATLAASSSGPTRSQ